MSQALESTARDHGLWFLNTRIVVRHAAEGGEVSVQEHWMPFGDSPPLHVHEREDEIFHILEGVIRFRVGEAEHLARAGESLVAPKGVPHSFRVESEGGARCLVMAPGGDFEGFVRAMSRPAEAPGLPPMAEPTPDQQQALAQTALAHRIEILGPPMGA